MEVDGGKGRKGRKGMRREGEGDEGRKEGRDEGERSRTVGLDKSGLLGVSEE